MNVCIFAKLFTSRMFRKQKKVSSREESTFRFFKIYLIKTAVKVGLTFLNGELYQLRIEKTNTVVENFKNPKQFFHR